MNDNGDPYSIDPYGFDHQSSTRWIRYFGKRGLEVTRERGGDLTFIAALHSPPGWMTRQKIVQGRDLDPEMKRIISESAEHIHNDPEGRQMLLLFRISRVVNVPPRRLVTIRALRERHQALTALLNEH